MSVQGKRRSQGGDIFTKIGPMRISDCKRIARWVCFAPVTRRRVAHGPGRYMTSRPFAARVHCVENRYVT